MRQRWLALAVVLLPIFAGCSFGHRCFVSETDAAGIAPFVMSGTADVGRTYRMRGVLLAGWRNPSFTRPLPASSSKARMK